MAPTLTNWDHIAIAAGNGDLYLDPAGEQEILAACTELAAELDRITRDIGHIGYVQKFSDLPSGIYFGELFQKIISGDSDSVVGRIKQTVQTAGKLRWVFERSFFNYKHADHVTLEALARLGKRA